MKNMKISAKLIFGFAIVAVIAAIIGTVGIIGIKTMDDSYTEAYLVQSKPVPDMAKVLEYSQRLRVNLRDYALYTGNAEQLKNTNATVDTNIATFEQYLDAYDATIVNPDARRLYDDAKSKYFNGYKPALIDARQKAADGVPQEQMVTVLQSTTDIANSMIESFEQCMEIKIAAAEANSDANTVLGNTMLMIMIGVLIFGVVVAMLLAVYISRIVSKPVILLDEMMGNLVKTGNFNLDHSELERVNHFGQFKDEPGLMARSFSGLLTMMLAKCATLETVADGDLTANVERISEKDTIGNSMQKMVDNLNKMFAEINSSSNQVSTGSVQIADGAQLLAQGATEQSATVEQLSASVTEVAEQTKTNASTAGEARDLAETIKASAEQGSQQMEQMMTAVAEINESSKSIGKVIKIIDDIAFQTNILALNAAVEAARAGQHGKGFAVVADEVRSLAAKSAEAAKNTNELIETSIQKAEQGASISAETAESLKQIVEGILKSTELVSNIARSSNEQSIAISQIGEAIEQVSQVVQQNSATAEESAAASEEMSGQATLLQQLIAQFKIKDSTGGGYTPSTPSAPARISGLSSPSSPETGFSLGSDKY